MSLSLYYCETSAYCFLAWLYQVWKPSLTSFPAVFSCRSTVSIYPALMLRRISSFHLLNYMLLMQFSLDFILPEKCSHMLSIIHLCSFITFSATQQFSRCLSYIRGFFPRNNLHCKRSIFVLETVDMLYLFTCILSEVFIFRNHFLPLPSWP